jgi:hypothetical protein
MSIDRPSASSSPASSSGKSRLLEDAIDDAMEDLAQRSEARARRESGHVRTMRERAVRISLAFALPALVAAIVWNVFGVSVVAARFIGPMSTIEEADAALRVVVDDIDAFHDDYGEFPVSLAEVGLPIRGEWRYTRIASDRYQLALSLGGQAVTHESQ